jgi:dTDP-4-dehydrorhamnose 3,5-epimerase-like enzyme
MSLGVLEDSKTVITKDREGQENGSIVELYKDGDKTICYMTTAKPGMFKGYHLHRIRTGQYVCIKGKMKVTLYKPGTKEKEEYILDSAAPQRLKIPIGIAAGLLNIGDEESWLVNYTIPPYDPSLKDEQVEYSEEELLSGVVK